MSIHSKKKRILILVQLKVNHIIISKSQYFFFVIWLITISSMEMARHRNELPCSLSLFSRSSPTLHSERREGEGGRGRGREGGSGKITSQHIHSGTQLSSPGMTTFI